MTEETYTCMTCGQEIDREAGKGWFLEDSHALYAGYYLRDGPDDETVPTVCDGCEHDFVGQRGDRYVVVYPQYADDPDAGGIVKHTAVVYQHIFTDTGYPGTDMDGEIEPEGPVFETIAAYDRGRDIPVEWARQFGGVPDDAAEWTQVRTGWHSSLESSEVSDRINALTRGDVGIYGPVIVKFGETNNVCSIAVSVYAPEGLTYYDKEAHGLRPFREYLEGAKSTPAGSF